MSGPRERGQFEAEIQELLDERYHHRHPFNEKMHAGLLDRDDLRIWVRNRYYYQTRIPIKDGMILAKSPEAPFRREWIQRIQDHDGREEGQGGLELWLQLAEAVGLKRKEVASLDGVLPGVRRACNAYVDFVGSHDLLESVAASLTELRAGPIMRTRIDAFEKHYSWIGDAGLAYFRSRTSQAPRDAKWGIAFVVENASTRGDQDRCLNALRTKCQILWSLLDSIESAAGRPRLVAHALRRPPATGDPNATSMVVLPERAVEISGSGSILLDRCDGTRRGEAIAQWLRANHPDAEGVEDDVYDFIQSMREAGVLEYVDEGSAE